MRNLKDKRFGKLTVLGAYTTFTNTRKRNERKWLCRCDCGTEKYILERSLLSGATKSCGCATRENSVKSTAYDLNGKVFGDLTVLRIASDHKRDSRGGRWWNCRCSCGNECDVLATLLVTGRKTHCGCKSTPKYSFEDISNHRFGRLTAKYPLSQRDYKGSVIWHCVCECGNEVDLSYNVLMYSEVRSCGCWKRERESKLHELITHVDGTSIDAIKSKKIPSNNTSGVKGVGFSNGKWFAKIVFQKKQYHLGKYDTIEEAIRARMAAEVLLFDGVAAHYENWKRKADSDPSWAKENPVQIIVSKKSASELVVTFLPIITI